GPVRCRTLHSEDRQPHPAARGALRTDGHRGCAPRHLGRAAPGPARPAYVTMQAMPSSEGPSSSELPRTGVWARIRSLTQAIQENDQAQIEEAVLRLSRSRRYLAPLAFAVGAFVLVFDALKLL